MNPDEAPPMEQLLRTLGIKRDSVFFLQPSKDQIQAIFPDMDGMAARILSVDFSVALGRQYIVIPFHCHPSGEGKSPKTKLYSLREGSCDVVTPTDRGYQIRNLQNPHDKALVKPGQWHAMIFSCSISVDVILSVKDDNPPLWTAGLDGLIASNPTNAQ